MLLALGRTVRSPRASSRTVTASTIWQRGAANHSHVLLKGKVWSGARRWFHPVSSFKKPGWNKLVREGAE